MASGQVNGLSLWHYPKSPWQDSWISVLDWVMNRRMGTCSTQTPCGPATNRVGVVGSANLDGHSSLSSPADCPAPSPQEVWSHGSPYLIPYGQPPAPRSGSQSMSQGPHWSNLYPQGMGILESSEIPGEQCQGLLESQTQPWDTMVVLWMSVPSPAKETG